MKYIALRVEDRVHARLSRKAGSRGLQKLAVHALESYLTKQPAAPALLSGLTDRQRKLVVEMVRVIERNPKAERILRAVVELVNDRR